MPVPSINASGPKGVKDPGLDSKVMEKLKVIIDGGGSPGIDRKIVEKVIGVDLNHLCTGTLLKTDSSIAK